MRVPKHPITHFEDILSVPLAFTMSSVFVSICVSFHVTFTVTVTVNVSVIVVITVTVTLMRSIIGCIKLGTRFHLALWRHVGKSFAFLLRGLESRICEFKGHFLSFLA